MEDISNNSKFSTKMDETYILSEDGKEIIGLKDKSLTHLTTPDSVICIGFSAFGGCTSLRLICLRSKGINDPNISISPNAFENIDIDKCILKIPAGTRWDYMHHPVFGKFKNVEIEK